MWCFVQLSLWCFASLCPNAVTFGSAETHCHPLWPLVGPQYHPGFLGGDVINATTMEQNSQLCPEECGGKSQLVPAGGCCDISNNGSQQQNNIWFRASHEFFDWIVNSRWRWNEWSVFYFAPFVGITRKANSQHSHETHLEMEGVSWKDGVRKGLWNRKRSGGLLLVGYWIKTHSVLFSRRRPAQTTRYARGHKMCRNKI